MCLAKGHLGAMKWPGIKHYSRSEECVSHMLIFVLQVSLTSWKPCVQLIFTFEVLSIGTFLAQLHKEEEPLVIATVEVSVEKF